MIYYDRPDGYYNRCQSNQNKMNAYYPPQVCCCAPCCTGSQEPTPPQGATGPQGPQGIPGPTGPTGAQGVPGSTGSTGTSETIQIRNTTTLAPEENATVTDLTGAPNHILDFAIPRGATGSTGPQGEQGPIAATIPFSLSNMYSSGSTISTDAQGTPETIVFAGFGGDSGYGLTLQPGEWASSSITITESYSYPNSFIMPFDGTLRNIYVLFANRQSLSLEAGVTMRPFVCLATSNSNALVFNILQNTIVYTDPYVGGTELPKYSVRRGSLTGLDITLPAGTLVSIVGGWVGEGVSSQESTQISFSGGLFIE